MFEIIIVAVFVIIIIQAISWFSGKVYILFSIPVVFIKNNYFFILGLLIALFSVFFLRLYFQRMSSDRKKSKVFKLQNELMKTSQREFEISLRNPKGKQSMETTSKGTNIGGKWFSDDELEPIDDLNFEKFAKELSQHFNDPGKFNDFLTGWWHRWGVERSKKAVNSLNSYITNLKEATQNVSSFQEELIKSKVIFKHQANVALNRLKNDWDFEQEQHMLRMEAAKTQRQREEFFGKFFKDTNPKDLSESALILLNRFSPQSENSSAYNLMGGISKNIEYGNIQDVPMAKRTDLLFDVLMKEKMADLELRKEEIKIKEQHTEQEKTKTNLAKATTEKAVKKIKEVK